jgi:hypothetical protein
MAALSGRDAQQAAEAARTLNNALMMALPVSDDGTEIVDLQAWKDAGVPEILRTTQKRIEQVLKRLER